MLLTYCIACQHGSHDACQGGQNPPEGMLGGWRCRCEGECRDRCHPLVSSSAMCDRGTKGCEVEHG